MTDFLSDPVISRFIEAHQQDDVAQLVLRYRDVNGVPIAIIADHIAGKQKAKSKFPFLHANDAIVFPPAVNIEQSSSEVTAALKKEFIETNARLPLTNGVDLTGGFGVDTFFLSQSFASFHYVEPDRKLFDIVRQNLGKMGSNIVFHNQTAEAFFVRITREI